MKRENHVRLLVLVCSCHEYADRKTRAAGREECKLKRQACRETWLADLPQGVQYAFFVGGDPPRDEPDVWGLDAPDTYHGLPQKVQAAFRRALQEPDWDCLFKCDDDTYCALSRLKAFADAQAGGQDAQRCIASWIGNAKNTAHGGAGYLLPRALVQAVAEDPLYGAEGIDHEDKQVTWSVYRAGGIRKGDRRFHAFMAETPAPDNGLITCHHASPDDMRRIFKRMQPCPQWLRPQGRALLPDKALPAPLPAAPHGEAPSWPPPVRIPDSVKRAVVLSNVTMGFSPDMVPLQAGDLVLHCNYARNAKAAMAVAGARHWLFVRHGRGRPPLGYHWYCPGRMDGYERIIFIDDALLLHPFGWFKEFRQLTRKSPTTGFIIANIIRELYPKLPLVLGGFDPGAPHGTPQWRGHNWQLEARWYQEKRFAIISPLPHHEHKE